MNETVRRHTRWFSVSFFGTLALGYIADAMGWI